jgi:hypothetical protein
VEGILSAMHVDFVKYWRIEEIFELLKCARVARLWLFWLAMLRGCKAAIFAVVESPLRF